MEIIQIAANICAFVIVFQLTTIIHELGHAIPARIFSKDKVTIYIGVGNSKRNFKIGNLKVLFRGFHPFTGFASWDGNKLTRFGKIVATLGGPLVSLMVGMGSLLIAGKIANNALNNLFTFIAYYNLFQFIITAIPFKYPSWWGAYGGTTSDGYKVLTLLKEKAEPTN
jgi:hypothetical protein